MRSEPGVSTLDLVEEPTLADLYETASVLALPSLYEGFGLPLLEAMARGVPAVIGKTGALPELAGGTAIEVDPEDVDAISDALEKVLSDSALRKKLGEGGKKRASAFTWDRAAAEKVEVLRRICSAA